MKRHTTLGTIALALAVVNGAAHAQSPRVSTPSHSCPATITAGSGPFDLAGAIAKYGGPQGLLKFTEEGLRELDGPYCATEPAAELCRVTRAVSLDVKAALLKCMGTPNGTPGATSEPRSEVECNSRYPADTMYQQNLACTQRVARENLKRSQANFDSMKPQDGAGAAAGAGGTASENPWAPKPFKPLDPAKDYSGQSCSYFTKPAREGDHRLNYYADNSFVCYGAKMYKCVARRWESKGPCAAYQDSKSLNAEKLESSDLKTKVHEE